MESSKAPTEGSCPHRVLAIDGGGIKGLFPAAFLACIEEEARAPIGHFFDLIAGTSTGGIIALGLALGYSAQDMLRFYRSLGPTIFGKPRNLIARFFRPKYDPEPLRNSLRDLFGDRTLQEAKIRLLIPSQSLETGEVYIYKTSHNERLQRDYRVKATDVALATASAPTYFPAHRDGNGLPLIDGGLWANNPTGSAAVEAVGVLGWKNVRILSIGCTREPADPRGAGGGLLSWICARSPFDLVILDRFGRGQSSAALGMARHLIGHENVVRVCPSVTPKRFTLDRFDESLTSLACEWARREISRLRPLFLDAGPAEPFVAFWPQKGSQ